MRDTGVPLMRPRYEALAAAGEGGQQRWLLLAKAPLADGAGWARQVLTVAFDVTELRRAEADSERAARHDPLTGLANAAFFRERCEHELVRARQEHRILALLHLDLDRFKGINDAFGQEFGDELLRAVAAG